MYEFMYYVDLSLLFSLVLVWFALKQDDNTVKVVAFVIVTINILFTSKEITLENKNRAIFHANLSLECKIDKEVLHPSKEDAWSMESHYFIKDKYVIAIENCRYI